MIISIFWIRFKVELPLKLFIQRFVYWLLLFYSHELGATMHYLLSSALNISVGSYMPPKDDRDGYCEI